MRHALWLTLVPLVALADAASAKKTLDTARTNLTQAVERIKVDPPSNADLEAAAAAVDELKAAIDKGAEFEASDLDYAKGSLTGRKELREKRDYVDQRRAMVKIFDARRAIDAAVKTLTERMPKVAAKEPSTSDFNDAQSALDAVKKTVDESRTFGKQDPKFAAYVTETDANVAKHQKAITDKRIALGVDKQRATLTAARDSLKSALGALKAGASDSEFKAADTAVGEVNKRLEEGKPLEPQAAYKAEADKARAEVVAAKKKMDDLWTATGLAKLKGEIDPAFQELLGAQKRLRSGKPTADQLAETRTAALVVRGQVDKFAAEAERSQAFGQYVTNVKKTLVDVETDLEKRTLGAAKTDVVAAQRAVEKASATDEQFAILTTAIGVLEKTLGTVHKDEPLLAPAVNDVQTVLKDAKAMAAKRRSEVDAERDKKTLGAAKAEVIAAQRAVEKASATDEQFAILSTAIGVLEKTVETVHKDEPLLAATLNDMQAVLKDAKAMAAKRRSEVDADHDKKTLGGAKGDVVAAQRAVEKANPTDEQFAILNTAIGVLEKTLGAVHVNEPLLAPTLKEMESALKDAKAMAAKRRLEVDVERQKAKVEDSRKLAAEAMKSLGLAGFGKEQIDSAENAVKLIGTVLGQGAGLVEKDKGYAFYDGEVKKRAKELEDKIAFKRSALAAADAKTALQDLVKATDAKIKTANAPEGKDSDVDAATKSLEAVNKMLEANAAIEKGGLSGYPAAADRARNNDVFRLTEQLEMAKFSRELRKKTGDVLAAAVAAVDAAASEQNLKQRKSRYDAALGQLRGCQQEGNLMLSNYPVLAKIAVVVDGKQSTPREVMAQCGQRAETAEQLMKDIAPMIKFEEGPKKSYESAKSLLDKGKKDEALKQFNECIATGTILAHDNPELKERKFQVAGTSLGLSEIITQCVAQRKALQGK